MCTRNARAGLLAITSILSGCALGPEVLQETHLGYNRAVQRAMSEELLLNIVRVRYLDLPQFLSVGSVSAQYAFEVGAGSELSRSGDVDKAGISPRVGYTDRPTITFVPRDDEGFLEGLATPIEVDTIARLAAGHHEIDRVLLLTTDNINGLASGEGFWRAVELLRSLQQSGELVLGFVETPEVISEVIYEERVSGSDHIAAVRDGLRFRWEGANLWLTGTRVRPTIWLSPRSEAAAELREVLGLEGERNSYLVRPAERIAESDEPSGELSLRTRSCYGTLCFLSKGVDVPEEDVAAGLAARVAEGAGISDLFRVRVSDSRPRAASVAVEHRGRWFWLADADASSRRTFYLAAALLRLELAGASVSHGPLLTLPVN